MRFHDSRFSNAISAVFLAACSSDEVRGSSPDSGAAGASGAVVTSSGGSTSGRAGSDRKPGTAGGGVPNAAGGVTANGGFTAAGGVTATGGVTGTGGARTGGSGGAGGVAGDAASGGTTAAGGSAGSGDAGMDCVTAGTELCEDFESGDIDARKWQKPMPSGMVTVTVDTAHAHGGRYALHVHGVAGQINNGTLTEAVTFPAKNNSFYARIVAYFYPDLPAMPGGDFHTGIIVGRGN